MTERKLEQNLNDGVQPTLKKAIIAFAIVEALVLIAVILYTISR